MISNPSYKANSYFIFLSAFFLMCLVIGVVTSVYWLAAIPFAALFFYFGWQQWQFIFLLLVFSLPWSVEYSFNSSLSTDLPDEPLMLLTAILFTAYLFFKPSQVLSVWKHPLILLLFFYIGWIVITILFSTDWLISLKFLLAKGWYLAAFVFTPIVFFKNKRSIVAAGLVFLISMLLVVLISLFKHVMFGFAFIHINDAVSPFFRNHVTYSAMLVCTVPVSIAAYQLSKRHRLLIIGMLIIILIALFFSYARGAWLALLVGIISYWLIRRRKLLVSFIVVLLLIIISVLWIKNDDRYLHYANDFRTTIFHENFEEHLVATYKLKDVSTAERFNRWVAGVRMIPDNWLTGYGPNTFYNNYKPYTVPAFRTWVSANDDHSTVHNYFLLTIIEQGVPGLLFFLLVVGGMLYYSEKIYKQTEDKFYQAMAMTCGVMLMMIIVVNFLSDLIETDKIGSLFFLCLATLVVADINTRKKTKSDTA